MNYKPRYLTKLKYNLNNRPQGVRGTSPLDRIWGSEDNILQADKRYAWMKHKAQAKYRDEEHSLTLEEWMSLWSDEDFLSRGKHRDSLCLIQIEVGKGWHLDNVEVVPRTVYLARAAEYRANKRG